MKASRISIGTILIGFIVVQLSATVSVAQTKVISEGKSADQNLKRKKSGVVQFKMYQKRNQPVPRLQIGEEPSIQSSPLNLKTDYNIQTWSMPSAPVNFKNQIQNLPVLKLSKFEDANNKNLNISLPNPPTSWLSPASAAEPQLKVEQSNQIAIKDLSTSEITLIQALLILQRQQKYNLAYAMLAELYNQGSKKNKELQSDIIYHLASAAKQLKLDFESRRLLLELTQKKEDPLLKSALEQLMKHAASGDLELVAKIDSLVDSLGLELKNASQYHINRAKYYMAKGSLGAAEHALNLVDQNSDFFADAQFLKGIWLYKSGRPKEAIVVLDELYTRLEKTSPDSEIKSIVALTLGRLHFQTADYKSSFKYYLGVNKAHPEWPQAMIEQAWTQLLAQDAEGAAGNMFGLHSDFFKNSFVPESFAVRAAAYLHLCQYGQAAKTVKMMLGRYQPLKEKLNQYEKEMNPKQNPNHAYETVKTFFKEAKLKEIDGLPRSFVWSLARTPSFISEQQMINSLEDQIQLFGRISIELIELEKQNLAEQNKILSELNKIAENKSSEASEARRNDLQQELANLKTQHLISKNLRQSAKALRTEGVKAMDDEKNRRKKLAASELNKKLSQQLASLSQAIDQIEVLQYEIFSGAGEHLRYQASGGQIDPKESRPLTVDEAKNQKWDYQGEIWEDELGHYRSSLKNVCAQVAQ